jgi:hypothetical protein
MQTPEGPQAATATAGSSAEEATDAPNVGPATQPATPGTGPAPGTAAPGTGPAAGTAATGAGPAAGTPAPGTGPTVLAGPADRLGRVLGRAAAAAITASLLLMIAIMLAGPSVVVPAIPRTWPVPPLWLALHPSVTTVTAGIYCAIVLGGAGVCCGLVAVRHGARPRMRLLLGAAVAAIAVLAVLPPGGSTDSLSYAAYGRIAAVGHNPYVMTPAQLRASGDPIGLQTTRYWATDPSLYGPVATAVDWAAAELGGTNIASIILWLKLLFALSFGAVALALDRLLRGDPAARARAHLLWTANPLMLWAVVGGAHADGLGAALGILGILVARTATASPGARVGVARALAAGLLVGAAVAVKAPLFPLGLGLAWSVRRSLRDLAAVAAGGILVVGGGYLIAGRAAISDLWTVGNGLVTFDSFWRLFYRPFGYTSAPGGLELLAFAGVAAVAALLAWRLPPGPARLPAVRPALVLMLAWLLVYPLQRPWYDAVAFCLMAVYCASRLDWVMLARAVPAALAVAIDTTNLQHSSWAWHLARFIGYDLSRWVRLGAVVAVVALCVLAAWLPRRPRRERLAAGQVPA